MGYPKTLKSRRTKLAEPSSTSGHEAKISAASRTAKRRGVRKLAAGEFRKSD
jgi:hypothetical protein